MVIAQAHYSEPDAVQQLSEGLSAVIDWTSQTPLFLCVGSDRHILDCFAPLIGTMLLETVPEICLCGCLDKPLHAKNMVRKLREIKETYPGRFQIAIDASLGPTSDFGYIKIKQESLIPGKAFAKSLPPVGQISIVGIVGTRGEQVTTNPLNDGSLAHVYHMAKVVAQAIAQLYQ
jgi:putative sporulation protein YyaC